MCHAVYPNNWGPEVPNYWGPIGFYALRWPDSTVQYSTRLYSALLYVLRDSESKWQIASAEHESAMCFPG